MEIYSIQIIFKGPFTFAVAKHALLRFIMKKQSVLSLGLKDAGIISSGFSPNWSKAINSLFQYILRL